MVGLTDGGAGGRLDKGPGLGGAVWRRVGASGRRRGGL